MKELLIVLCVFLLGPVALIAGQMSYMGNPSTPPAMVGNDILGAVYMMKYRVQKDGLLFAFQMWFKNLNRTRVQVWRPVNLKDRTFRLVAQWTIQPRTINMQEDVYIRDIDRSTCFLVKPGDRVAVLTYQVPGSAVTIFKPPPPKETDYSTFTLAQDDSERNWVKLNEVAQFDGVGYPYENALTAWIDNDLAKYGGGTVCRDDVNIPRDLITTPATPTGRPGPPGQQGPEGPQGPKGDKGDPGKDGAQGQQGPPGPKGDSGDSGSSKGEQGPQGIQGIQGQKGDRGDKGTRGDRGQKGDSGSAGQAGTDGVVGPTGPKGDTGARGPPGPPGNSGGNFGSGTNAAQSDGSCTCGTGLLHPNLILGLIIWLLIVTLLIIMILILMTCQKRTDRDRDRVSEYRRDNPWMDPTMREDNWKEYTVDTISQ